MVEAIHEHAGVLLGVTTALIPSQLSPGTSLDELFRSGKLNMGWIALTGAEPPPLVESPAPELLSSFILHWGPQHASVGELLASTDTAMDPAQAQTWAMQFIALHETVAPTWKGVLSDPSTWELLDPISLKFFFLRRHPDGWQLVKALSRIGGATGTEDEMKDWARRAVKRHAKATIVDWLPHPNTSPGYTTLIGSGAH